MPDPIKLYKELKEYKDVDGNVQDLIPKYKTEQEFTTALGDRNYRQKLHQYLSANELLPDGAESYVQFEKDVMGGIVSKPQAAVKEPAQAKPKGAAMPYSGEPLSDQAQRNKNLFSLSSPEEIPEEEPALPYEGPYSESYQKVRGVSEFDKEKAIAQQNTGKPLYAKSKKELETEYQEIMNIIHNPHLASGDAKYSLRTGKQHLQDLELKAAEYEDVLSNLYNPDRHDVLDPNSVLNSNIESGLIPQDAYTQAKNVSKLNESALRNRYQEINEKIAKDVGIDGYDVIGTYEQLKTLEAEGRLTPEQQETKARIESNELIPKLAQFRDKLDRQTLAIEAAYPAEKNLEKAAREYQIAIDDIDKSGMLGPVAEIGRVMASTGVKVAESINAMENTLQNLSISLTGKMIPILGIQSAKVYNYNALVDRGDKVGAAKFLMDLEEKENLGYKSLGIKYMQPSNRQISPLAQIANKDGILYEIEDGQVTAVRDSEGYIIPEPSEKIISQAREIEKDPEKFNPSRVNNLGIRSLATATQGAQIISDMAPILAMGAVSGGTGVALGSFATMYGPLYEQGIKEFGSANKAALYATSLAAIMSLIEVKLGKVEQQFGNAVRGRFNREAISADLRDVSVRFTNGELTPTQFSTEGIKAFIGRTVSELPGELKEEVYQYLTEEIGQSVTGIKKFKIDLQELGEIGILTPVATLPVGALTATIAGNQFKAGLRSAIDKPALLQKELDSLVAEGTITQDQADETEIFIQNIVDIGLEYQENGASKKTVQKIKDLNLDKAIEQKRADNAKTELVKTKAEKAVAAIDAKIKEIDATIGTKQEDTVTEEPIEPITNTDQPSPEQDETDGGVTPATVSPIATDPESEADNTQKTEDVKIGFQQAGEKSRETKDATHIGRWMLNNAQKGDVVRFQDNGYEVTAVNTKKDGTKELILTPFEFNEDGTKDYNNTGIKLISEQSIKNGSNLFESSYTNGKGERVVEQSTYERDTPIEEVPNEVLNDVPDGVNEPNDGAVEGATEGTSEGDVEIKVGDKVFDADGVEYEVLELNTSRKGAKQATVKLPNRTEEQIQATARNTVFGRNENRLLYKSPDDPKFIKEQSIPISQQVSDERAINKSNSSVTIDLTDLKKSQPTQENPKSEETNKPITAKAKSGSLYTRQSNGTWKSERGVVATSPKLVESLNEQVKDLVSGFDSRDSQKSEGETDNSILGKPTPNSVEQIREIVNKTLDKEQSITGQIPRVKDITVYGLPETASTLQFIDRKGEKRMIAYDAKGKEVKSFPKATREDYINLVKRIADETYGKPEQSQKSNEGVGRLYKPQMEGYVGAYQANDFVKDAIKRNPEYKRQIEAVHGTITGIGADVKEYSGYSGEFIPEKNLQLLKERVSIIIKDKLSSADLYDKGWFTSVKAETTSDKKIDNEEANAKEIGRSPKSIQDTTTITEADKSKKEVEKSQKTREQTTKTKQGFTETKDLNRMYKEVKTKYGIKEGGKIIDTALRLVDTTKNTIVEIRSNGVVVKEEGKFLFKPFTKAEGNSKKTILGKPMDISDQFESPKSETKAEAGSVGVGGDVEVFHLVENEGLWKATTKSYRGRDTGNWVYSRLDKKQTNEYNKLRDAADNYGTKEQAEENLKKLKDFERENKEAFQEAKKAIDGLKQEEERQSEENKKQQKIIDETSKELDRLSDKDFDKLVELIDEKRRQTLEQRFGDRVERRTLFRTPISESYHAAKADGSNPELVKAVEQSLKETTKVEPKQEKREPNPKPKAEPKSKEQELTDKVNSVLNDDTDLQFSRSDTKKDSPLYVDKSSTVKHSLSPMLVNQIAEAEKEGNRPKLISLRVIKALLPTFRAAGITLKLHPDGDSMMAAQRQANDFGTAAKGFYNPKTKEIHLNLESLTTDTPIHEILHPIVGMAMKAKPDVVKNWVESIKSDPIMGKDLAEFIERNYGKEKPDIKEAELVVTYVGQRVAEILSADPKNQESRGQDPEPKKSLYKKLIQKVKDLLNDLGIGLYKKDIIGEIGNETSVSDLAYTIADIISRRGVIQFQPSQNGNMQKQVDAWHGTPHQLKGGKFSTEFIGTGEGAQAFGWGLYFTDIKSIAENYAETLSDTLYTLKGSKRSVTLPRLFQSGLVPAKVYDIVFDIASNQKTVTKNSILSTLDKKINSAGLFSRYSKENLIETKKFVEDSIEEVIPNQRNLVKATLHKGKTPDQYNWLEWDKPVSKKQLDLMFDGDISGDVKEALDGWFQEKGEYNIETEADLKDAIIDFELSGKELYKILEENIGENPNAKNASFGLLNSGIDGIKYPAESLARGTTSDNTRGFNYVVFDENAITVEEQIQFSRDDNFKSWVEGKVNKLFDKIPDMYGNKESVDQSIEGIYEWLKEKGKELSKADKSLIAARMKEKFGIVDDKIIEAQTRSKATFNNQKAEDVAENLNIKFTPSFTKQSFQDHIDDTIEANLNAGQILNRITQGDTSLSVKEYFTLVMAWGDTKNSVESLQQRNKLGLATPTDLMYMDNLIGYMEDINDALVRARSDAGLILGSGSHFLPLPKARSVEEIYELYNKAAGDASTEQSQKATQKLAEDLAKLEAELRAELEDTKAANEKLEAEIAEMSVRISTGEIKAKKINPSRINSEKGLIDYALTMAKSKILKSKTEGDTDSDVDPIKVRREFILGAVKVAIEGGVDHTSITAVTDAVNELIGKVNVEIEKAGEQAIKPTDTKEIIANLLPIRKSNINGAATKVNKAVNELRVEAKRTKILENLLNGIYNPKPHMPQPSVSQVKNILDKIRVAANKSETSEEAKTEINSLLDNIDLSLISYVDSGSKAAISRAIDAVRSLSKKRDPKGKMSYEEKESAIAKDTAKWNNYKIEIDNWAKDKTTTTTNLIDLITKLGFETKKQTTDGDFRNQTPFERKLQAKQSKLRKLRANLRGVAETARKKANASVGEKTKDFLDDLIFIFLKAVKVTWDMSSPFTVGYEGGMSLIGDSITERDSEKAKVILEAFSKSWDAFKAGMRNDEDVAIKFYEELQKKGGDIYEHLFGLKLSHPFDPELSEEYFRSNIAAKFGLAMGKNKLGIKANLFQASEAHMTTYLNTIRFALFDAFYRENPGASKEELENYAETVNMLTGTTKMNVNGFMTRAFLAPKYMLSRLKMFGNALIPPIKITKTGAGKLDYKFSYSPNQRSATVRKAIGMSLAVPASLHLISALLAGDDEPWFSVDWNPLSPSFLKMQIGDTNIETIAGLTNIARTVMQTALIVMNAQDWGNLTEIEKSNALTAGNYGNNIIYPAWNYISGRLNPSVGVAKTLLTREDFKGDPYKPGLLGVGEIVGDVVGPIFPSSLWENTISPTDNPSLAERILQPTAELFGVPIINYQNAGKHKDVQNIFKKADWSLNSKAVPQKKSWTYPHEYFRSEYKNELRHRVGLAVLALKKAHPDMNFTYKTLDQITHIVKNYRWTGAPLGETVVDPKLKNKLSQLDYGLPENRQLSIDKYIKDKSVRLFGEETLNKYVGNAKAKKEKEEAEKKEHRSK